MKTSKYSSKMDPWIIILIIVVPALLIGLGVITLDSGISGIITLACGIFAAVLMILLLVPLHYTLTQDSLVIRYGIMKERVRYNEIKEVRPSNDSTSAPTLSLERVEIVLKEKSKLISLKDRDQFIQEIQNKIST